ncbi:alginate export family protein [Deferrisoma palaeochoriense]
MRTKSVSKTLAFVLAAAGLSLPAAAAEFAFHGDLNNRFNVWTNHSEVYNTSGALEKGVSKIQKTASDSQNTTWGEVKYRLWTEAATNDGAVKGVYAIELGSVRFGRSGSVGKSVGGEFSGDGVNIETRWAYTDFQVPGEGHMPRVRIGLQPFSVNKYLWEETAMGVSFQGTLGPADYRVAWMRGKELFNDEPDENLDSLDSFLVRFDGKPIQALKMGAFVLYQHENSRGAPGAVDAGKYGLKQFGDVDLNLYSLGIDGRYTRATGFGNLFFNFDLIYQTGEVNNAAFTGLDGSRTGNFDLAAWFAHADLGVNVGKTRLTYHTWYASGDDDASDGDFNAFLATDVDMVDSVIFFEGGYTDDTYITERPYLLDKGLFLNKLAVDFLPSSRLKVGAALLYLVTAEDLEYTDGSGRKRSENALGTELDAYVSYKLYENVELALNAGYLFAGDAMDAFEIDRDGKADENLFRSTARVRYKF